MKNIWTLIFGIFMISGGIYALFNPLSALIAVALYIGIIFIAMGISYLQTYRFIKFGSILALGVLDILVGILFITNLGISAATLPFILALWTILVGALQIIIAIQLKKEKFPTWSLRMGTGVFGSILGLLMLIYPIFGALVITILIGISLILFGILEVIEYKNSYN